MAALRGGGSDAHPAHPAQMVGRRARESARGPRKNGNERVKEKGERNDGRGEEQEGGRGVNNTIVGVKREVEQETDDR